MPKITNKRQHVTSKVRKERSRLWKSNSVSSSLPFNYQVSEEKKDTQVCINAQLLTFSPQSSRPQPLPWPGGAGESPEDHRVTAAPAQVVIIFNLLTAQTQPFLKPHRNAPRKLPQPPSDSLLCHSLLGAADKIKMRLLPARSFPGAAGGMNSSKQTEQAWQILGCLFLESKSLADEFQWLVSAKSHVSQHNEALESKKYLTLLWATDVRRHNHQGTRSLRHEVLRVPGSYLAAVLRNAAISEPPVPIMQI